MRRAKVIASFGLLALLLSLRSASAQPQGVSGCPGSDQNNVCTGSGDDRDYGLVAGGVVRMKITRSGAVTFPGALSVTLPAVLGQALHADGTAAAPSISFTSASDKGFYAATNLLGVATGGNGRWAFDSSGSNHQFTLAGTSLAFSSAAGQFGNNIDTTIARTAAGKISLTGTTPVLQFGGTTSSFPALKRNTTSTNAMAVQLADDSALTGLAASAFNAGSASIGAAGTLRFTASLQDGTSGNVIISQTAPSSPTSCGVSPSISANNGTAAFTVTHGSSVPVATCSWTMPAAATGWACSAVDITTATANVFLQKQTAGTTTSVTISNFNTAGALTAFVASDVTKVSCFAY